MVALMTSHHVCLPCSNIWTMSGHIQSSDLVALRGQECALLHSGVCRNRLALRMGLWLTSVYVIGKFFRAGLLFTFQDCSMRGSNRARLAAL